jgi:hypothetical protein
MKLWGPSSWGIEVALLALDEEELLLGSASLWEWTFDGDGSRIGCCRPV